MNNRLTIKELASMLAVRTGRDKEEMERFLREFVALVSEHVFIDKVVKIKGLGSFKIITVEKRESIHVNTGERIEIPDHYKFSFVPDKELKDIVNKPFSFFETTEINEGVQFPDLAESSEPMEDESSVEEEEEETLRPEAETDENIASPEEEQHVDETVSDDNEQNSAEEVEPEIETEEVAHHSDVEEETAPDNIPEPESNVEEVVEEVRNEEPEEVPELPAAEEASHEEEIPVVEETPQPNEVPAAVPEEKSEMPQPKKNKSLQMLVAFWIAVFVVGISVYIYNNVYSGEEVPSVETTEKPAVVPETVIPDTLDVEEEKADTAAFVPDTVKAADISSETEEVKQPANNPKEIGKDTIAHGDRLTVIALKYYGHKIFWVYLYEYNKAVIADPNNVPIGTEIRIPAPELYGIDASSAESREKAAALQSEILTKKY